MMNLFSSFNPITSSMTSLNWLMMIMPPIIMMNSPWNSMSVSMKPNKMLVMNTHTQFKSSVYKMSTPVLIIIIIIMMTIMTFNMTSLLPNSFSTTSHLMVNMAMALSMWLALMMKKLTTLKKLLSHLTPSNTPPILIPFMVIIELISTIIQPLTLSIRLTANITAGHIMMVLISQMYNNSIMLALMMNMMMMSLELGVGPNPSMCLFNINNYM
uniref:ATP synthase subunit a n=1 Tax=Wallacidia oculata TaxID=590134 RepID=E0WBN7_9HYME|nr:ATP synthase F0 subunit 6 [Wallacidia oculata]